MARARPPLPQQTSHDFLAAITSGSLARDASFLTQAARLARQGYVALPCLWLRCNVIEVVKFLIEGTFKQGKYYILVVLGLSQDPLFTFGQLAVA